MSVGPATAAAPPVVLIHGALRGRLGLLPTAAYLRRYGIHARAFGYRTRGASLEEHAAALEAFIQEWKGEDQLPILGLLTHSMGGLVARAYLARRGARRQSRTQRLVMLAPPNQGSALATAHRDRRVFRALYGQAGQELLAARVAQLAEPPSTCAVMILAGGAGDPHGYNSDIPGDDDGVVGVSETRLSGIEPEIVGGIHSLLQWRPSVLDRAGRFLLAAHPVALGDIAPVIDVDPS